MNVIELVHLLTGTLGVALTAQGLRGLHLRRNAATAWDLTDPIGRFDCRFSEGQFNLILQHLQQEFALSSGALFLLVSLVLSTTKAHCVGWEVLSQGAWTIMLLRLGSIFTGMVVSVPLMRIVHRLAIRGAAREVEERARSEVQRGELQDPDRRQLCSWFVKRVGREPDLRCDGPD